MIKTLIFVIFLAPVLLFAEAGSATVAAEQRGWKERRAEKTGAIKERQFDLLMIGDSITHNFDKPAYREVWDQFYAPRKAINLGYSGGRTENTLWNLTHGELKGQSPKVVTLLIGTNNTDDANYPVVHSAQEVFEGTKAIVQLLRKRLPSTKILLLRIFPRTNVYRSKDGKERGSAAKRFAVNHRAGELASTLADGEWVHCLDVNHVFYRADGTLDPKLMPDQLHPSPAGARAWAEAMEPKLAELFGDEPKSPKPTNSALVPLPKIENDFYDWWKRHEAVMKIKDELHPEIVLLGDSITHLWGGLPEWKGRKAMGPKSFAKTFVGRRVLNLGYGFDRIQNVLWRLDHGEVRGLKPKHVILNIGTNNLWPTKNARGNTPEEIAEGIRAVIQRLRAKLPEAHLTLMGIFPRGQKADDRSRAKVAKVNELLIPLGKENGITFLDLGDKLIEADETIRREVMPDFLHPAEPAYEIWGKALQNIITE
jgi:lysophospholipase L1-like esterase|tara:strand:+ start:110 stop:1555 length:1446 start_codon:yes stop_codon:yes gene_type:complete